MRGGRVRMLPANKGTNPSPPLAFVVLLPHPLFLARARARSLVRTVSGFVSDARTHPNAILQESNDQDPNNTTDLTDFVQNLLQQMVSD